MKRNIIKTLFLKVKLFIDERDWARFIFSFLLVFGFTMLLGWICGFKETHGEIHSSLLEVAIELGLLVALLFTAMCNWAKVYH